MKYEVIMRVQETRYSDKVDKYRTIVPEERFQGVIKQYESHLPSDCYGAWVLVNKLDDQGNFIEVIQ